MSVIRGADVRVELWADGAWLDLTCEATSADWQWGASEPLGPLTESEGGRLRVSLRDPERKYDPANPASPLYDALHPGAPVRATVDGAPAWTGALQTWGRDRDSGIADLVAFDPIAQLSLRTLPNAVNLLPPGADVTPATTAQQAQFVLDTVGWDAAARYFPAGTAGVQRGAADIQGSALDILGGIRFAELGRLYARRDGAVGWQPRDVATPAVSVILQCGELADLWEGDGLGRVRNRVVIQGWSDVTVEPDPDLQRTVFAEFLFLNFFYPGAPAPVPWDLWASAIMDALGAPLPMTLIGSIMPEGSDVAAVLCAEYGASWTVVNPPHGDKSVRLLGQRVTLSPGLIEVDAVTEDLTAAPPTVRHVTLGAGSGSLHSADAAYAPARAGTGAVLPEVLAQLDAGQYGPVSGGYHLHELMLWFDTSLIPTDAVIISASFAAQWGIRFGSNPFSNPVLQVRSYPSGGWRPTLAGADWLPGATIGTATTLRAVLDTRVGQGFRAWTDSGNLAAAIVKGGATQLVVVTDRFVAGTPPSAAGFDVVTLQFPRLRVTYRVP